MPGIDEEISAAGKEIDQLEDDLRRAKALLHDLRCQKAGIKAGDIVREKATGKLHRVIEVRLRPEFGVAWIFANPQRKDGSFGYSILNLYSDWEKVDESHDPK